MRVKDTNGLYSIDPVFSYKDLEHWLPLPAVLAKHDLLDASYHDYMVLKGGLYCRTTGHSWYEYDQSFRKWVECQKPEGA